MSPFMSWARRGLLGVMGGLAVLMATAAHAGSVTYVYTDPQGTPLAEADASGNITATYDYAPYGSQALGTPPSGPGYTGHVNDPDTGLVYMQARYYDPVVGRFLSTDPVGPAVGNTFNFSRYAYASNNPIVNMDPDGRYTCDKNVCEAVKSYVGALKQSLESLKANPRTSKEASTVQKAITAIGPEGKGGPHYVAGEVAGQAAAHTDQNGTTTIDVAKVHAAGDKTAEAQAGAQAIGHEVTHDMDIKANNGPITTEAGVRKTEENAYNTSRAVDKGFGKVWTDKQYNDAVNTSVKIWIDNDNGHN